jgi:hypothetical protein
MDQQSNFLPTKFSYLTHRALALAPGQKEPVPALMALMAADRMDIPHTLNYNLGRKYANLS